MLKLIPLLYCLTVFLVFSTCDSNANVNEFQNATENPAHYRIDLTEEEKTWLEQNPVVRARIGAMPPLHFFDVENRGISVDYLNLIAEIVGFQVEYVLGIPWNKAIEDIKNHEKFDILLTAKNTKDRQEFMFFTDDYLLMPWVIFTRTDGDFISSVEDLFGKTVAVEKSFVMQKMLMTRFPEINLLVKEHSIQSLQAVASGEADAYIGNLATSTYIINTHNLANLKVACPAPLGNHNQAFAVRNDWPELVSILNKAIKGMPANTLTELRNNWFNMKYEYGISTTDLFKWIGLVVGSCAILLLLFALWNQRLKNEIKERKQADEEKQKIEATLKAALESMTDAVFISDSTGRLVQFNTAFATFHKFSSKDDCYSTLPEWHNILDVFLPNGQLVPLDMWVVSRALRGEQGSQDEFVLKRKDTGEEWTASYSFAPIRGGDGTIVGTVVVGRDITEKRKAEKQLQQSQERFEIAMEAARDGLYDWNLITNAIYYSPGWKRMLGYQVDELPNDFSIWEKLIAPEDLRKSWEMQQELVNRKRDRFELEFKMKHKDGHWVDILSRATAVFDDAGKAARIVGTHVDISERKRLEASLLQAQKMESIGTLAGGIAHEFNNMLAIIMGNNELIMDELPLSSLGRESAEEIKMAGLRARDVVKQLLTFSRNDDSVKKVMDFKLIVQESMKLIRSTTPANIKIEQNLSADIFHVVGNETQINQILINLCNNAVHAMPKKEGVIKIELLKETIGKHHTKLQTKLNPGQYVKLMVSDNGIGMDNDILDRVFEPYFTTKDIGEGTGIGMAVVHGIVERHGGAIIADSTPGHGTTFTIFLPAHDDHFKQENGKRDILPVGDECILYVDDEPSLAILGKRLLDSLGYTTETITDPKEALALVRNDPYKFDLLITDMAMPNMTGDQLIAEILKIRQDMPTIICTGYSAKFSENEAKEMGISSFAMKPLAKKDLATVVRNVLDTRQTL